jgi:hypothetical protein
MEDNGNQPAAEQRKREEAERRAAQREKTLALKRALVSDSGRRILSDLCAKFGFDEQEHENSAYTFGCTGTDLAWREGTKDPIRHLLKMRDMVVKPLGDKPKSGRAKSMLAPGA